MQEKDEEEDEIGIGLYTLISKDITLPSIGEPGWVTGPDAIYGAVCQDSDAKCRDPENESSKFGW